MRIGIVHTKTSQTCGCAPAIARGVKALGWVPIIVDCQDVVANPMVLSGCDAVFDHTDTFRDSGELRPFIRLVLESQGYCVVGSDAQTCLRCDHKISMKRMMECNEIPVPQGIVYTGGDIVIPKSLRCPFILKCGCEHMSRALRVIDKREDLWPALKKMYKEVKQPIIIEEVVGVREVEVGVIPDGRGMYTVLPYMEWIPPEGRGEVFTYMRKQVGGSACVRADFLAAISDRLNGLALRAFDVLHIRDYCRFDVRVGVDGSLYFLEANAIPNMEEEQGMAKAALAKGIQYPDLIRRLVENARRREKNQILR